MVNSLGGGSVPVPECACIVQAVPAQRNDKMGGGLAQHL